MRVLTVLAVSLLASAASADQVAPETPAAPAAPAPALTLTPGDFSSWAQMTAALNQCVGAATNGSDTSVCKSLQAYLGAFATRVQALAPAAPAAVEKK